MNDFEPEPLHLPLELPLVETPSRMPGQEDDEPTSDAGDDRPRVIVIDLC